MAITLYNAMLSPYSARVRIAIYARGLDVDIKTLPDDFTFDALSALTPIGKVPTLVDGELVVPESEVILRYLDDRFPETSLMPKTPHERMRARLLGRISDLYMLEPMIQLFAQINPKSRDGHSVAQCWAELDRATAWLAAYLPENGTHAVGDRLSHADAMIAPVLFLADQLSPMFGRDTGWPEAPKVAAYFSALSKDPAIARVFEEARTALEQRMI